MSYAIIIDNRVAQISDTFIEVAAPIECVEIPANTEVKENYTYAKDANGNVTYTAPVVKEPEPIPLKDQAQYALNDVQSRASMIVAMGETFGEKTKAYVAALKAIIAGTDTTSTKLPDQPSDLTT